MLEGILFIENRTKAANSGKYKKETFFSGRREFLFSNIQISPLYNGKYSFAQAEIYAVAGADFFQVLCKSK